jgi:hypothetical protein
MGETVSLTGGPQSQGMENTVDDKGGDTYYYLNTENNDPDRGIPVETNCTAPILGIVSLTQWMFGVGETAIYETSLIGNDALRRYFPNALQRLGGS